MRSALAHAYATAGDTRHARRLLGRLEREAANRYVSSYELGLIHAALGETDAALERLHRAVDERSGWIPYLRLDPRLDGLRREDGFSTLLGRAGLDVAVPAAPRRRRASARLPRTR